MIWSTLRNVVNTVKSGQNCKVLPKLLSHVMLMLHHRIKPRRILLVRSSHGCWRSLYEWPPQVTWWKIQHPVEESSAAPTEPSAEVRDWNPGWMSMLCPCYVQTNICTNIYLQGSGRALSGGSPALTTSGKPCSQCSSASHLRGGQICSTGSVVALNEIKRSVLFHLFLPDPRLTGEYLAVHLLCVHGRPRSLLRDEPYSRCSQRVNIHYSSSAFFFFSQWISMPGPFHIKLIFWSS